MAAPACDGEDKGGGGQGSTTTWYPDADGDVDGATPAMTGAFGVTVNGTCLPLHAAEAEEFGTIWSFRQRRGAYEAQDYSVYYSEWYPGIEAEYFHYDPDAGSCGYYVEQTWCSATEGHGTDEAFYSFPFYGLYRGQGDDDL